VRKASEDYVKVMIDYRKASKKKKKTIDTGLFKRTYKSRVKYPFFQFSIFG
jgi:hypothetical protein